MFYHAARAASGYNSLSMRRAASFFVLAVAAGALVAPAARALDPEKAAPDVSAARSAGGADFCASPPRPLPPRARRLCAHAKEIPSCEGFVAACADAEAGALRTAPSAAPGPSPASSVVASALGVVAQLVVWALVIGVVAIVAVLVVRALLRMRRDVALADPPPKRDDAQAVLEEPEPRPSDAEALLARAEAHARRGELEAALHAYLAAALHALDRRDAIRIARDRTNGEYVRACKEESARARLREIVGEVDRVQFGGERATDDAVARAGQRAVALVRAVPAAVVALALLLATAACGGGGGGAPLRSEDPAGSELFVAMMRKQGVTVTRAPASLATLPMPASRETAPTVVVDTDLVTLDDESSAHLMRWVEAGGALVLAGKPEGWPKELGAKPREATGDRVFVMEDSDAPAPRIGPAAPRSASVAIPAAVTWGDVPLAWFAEGETYAAMHRAGQGLVVGIATDELLTNAALARPANARALVTILGVTEPHELYLARPEDAIAPPSNPVSGMIRAGLGLGLAHALALAAVLFLAAGVRLARPKPTPPPARRAFAESVEASGALWARAKMAPHALASYARFVDERLRAKMPRRRDAAHGTSDVAAFLATRAGADPAECEVVWQRAKNTRPDEPARGDELDVLKRLASLYAAATSSNEGRP